MVGNLGVGRGIEMTSRSRVNISSACIHTWMKDEMTFALAWGVVSLRTSVGTRSAN